MEVVENTIGGRIKFVREFRRMTTSDLAMKVGCQKNEINRLENERVKWPNSKKIFDIAKALECTTDFIYCTSDQFEKFTYADAIAYYMKPITIDQQEACLILIRRQCEMYAELNISKKKPKPISNLIFKEF